MSEYPKLVCSMMGIVCEVRSREEERKFFLVEIVGAGICAAVLLIAAIAAIFQAVST